MDLTCPWSLKYDPDLQFGDFTSFHGLRSTWAKDMVFLSVRIALGESFGQLHSQWTVLPNGEQYALRQSHGLVSMETRSVVFSFTPACFRTFHNFIELHDTYSLAISSFLIANRNVSRVPSPSFRLRRYSYYQD